MQNKQPHWVVLLILFSFTVLSSQSVYDPLAEEKSTLIKSLEKRFNIRDRKIITALESVKREDFLPQNMIKYSYVDISLPLDSVNTIISHSDITKVILNIKNPDRGKVLIIGRNCGFAAAVVASLYTEVFVIESNTAEEERYRMIFPEKYGNVNYAFTNDYSYFSASAPFDLILLNGTLSGFSGNFMEQLKEGGEIIFPMTDSDGFQLLYRAEKHTGTYTLDIIGEVMFPPLR